MHPNTALAKELNCTRLIVDRAIIMLNLIHSFLDLTIEERIEIVNLLILRDSQSRISAADISIAFKACPLEDCGSLPNLLSAPSIILALGQLTVAEWLPDILQEITQTAPAQPAIIPIVPVTKPPQQPNAPIPIPERAEEHSDKTIEHRAHTIGNWEVIFRSYDPIQGRHHYQMLRCGAKTSGAALSSMTGGLGSQEDLPLLLDEWRDVQDRLGRYHHHFKTPDCLEEEELIADLIRRNGPLEDVYLISFTLGQPNPSRRETLSGKGIQVHRERKYSQQALSTKVQCNIQSRWPGGLSLHNDGQEQNWHCLKQGNRRCRESWQTASFWTLNYRKITGENAVPLRWSVTQGEEQVLRGDAGQQGVIEGRNSLYTQFSHSEKPPLFPELVHSAFDSRHMALLIGENPIALKEQSNHVVDRQAPTLKGTPPARVKREMDSTISSSIQPNPSGRIHNSIVSEQFTSALEEDSTRPTDSLYHNLITLSHRLEAQWGTAENGLTLNIDAPAGLATVEEYICDKEEINSVKIQAQGTIETLPAIGTIKVVHDGIETVHILDFITYNSTGLFNRSMQTMSARREDWSEVFENEEKEEDVELHHSLMLNCASVGFSIRDSSLKK